MMHASGGAKFQQTVSKLAAAPTLRTSGSWTATMIPHMDLGCNDVAPTDLATEFSHSLQDFCKLTSNQCYQ